MATFTVHALDGEVIDPVTDVRFLRDGFSPAALIFGGLWFLWHRMWLVFGGYMGLVLLLAGLVGLGFLHPVGATLLQSVLAIAVGLQATALRHWHMGRKGFSEIGVVTGANEDEAELRYFALSA